MQALLGNINPEREHPLKNMKKRIAAIACATALLFAGSTIASPAAHTSTVIGYGAVDILGQVNHNCTGTCTYSEGAGVVVANPWGTNEVLTVDHVIAAMDPLSTIYIYEPSSGVWQYGYVQRTDPASDLAVLWIYSSWSQQGGIVGSPYTYQTAGIAGGSNSPANGTQVESWGDHNSNWTHTGTWFDQADGTVVGSINGSCGGGAYLYNMIETTWMTQPGDSGGPLFNTKPGDPNEDLVVGLNECSSVHGGAGSSSEAIQIQWAYYDMLHLRP